MVKTVSKNNWNVCVNDYQMQLSEDGPENEAQNDFTYPLYPLDSDGNSSTVLPGPQKCAMYNNSAYGTETAGGKQVFVDGPGLGGKNQNQCDYVPFVGSYKCGGNQYTMYTDNPDGTSPLYSDGNQSIGGVKHGAMRTQPTLGNFNCGDQYNFCNKGMLILNDDGSMSIKNGSQAKAWLAGTDSGYTWKSSYPTPPYVSTSGSNQKMGGSSDWPDSSVLAYPDPNYAANNPGNGAFVARNYLFPNEMLKKNEWIGSTNGCFFVKMEANKGAAKSYADIMKADETSDVGIVADVVGAAMGGVAGLALEQAAMAITGAFQELGASEKAHMGLVVYYNKLKCVNDIAQDKNSMVLYELSPPPNIESINKVGLVGDGTQIHEYPDSQLKPGQKFFDQGRYDTPGNTIKSFKGDYDSSGCGALCLENNNCAGFVIDNDKNCNLKNKGMFPKAIRTPNPDTHYELYVRSKAVKNNLSCPKEVEQTSALQWELYPLGKKMTMDTLCELGLASKEERETLKEANKELMDMKLDMSSKLNKLEREDTTLSASLSNNIEKLQKDIEKYDKTLIDTAKVKSKTNNINARASDSELDMISRNTSYMLWSILAIIVVIGGIKATRN